MPSVCKHKSLCNLQCPDGVCIGLCLHEAGQKTVLCGSNDCFIVDSKGNVKQFFGLRFGRFSARV